jgi:hypothetical protein
VRRAVFSMIAAVSLVWNTYAAPTQRVEYSSVLPELLAHVSKKACSLPTELRTKDKYVVASALGNWSATVLETDPVAVPYDKARACIQLQGSDGVVRSVTIGAFRTLRLQWLNERLLYLFTDVGHVAGVGQLLDVDDMKWLYARTESYPP